MTQIDPAKLREALHDIEAFVEVITLEVETTGASAITPDETIARIIGQQHVLALGLLHVLDELDRRHSP